MCRPTIRTPIRTRSRSASLARKRRSLSLPDSSPFLLTEEVVSVPADALAFISIRAKTKFRGLVNVSGFHVDPGYCGQLTFARSSTPVRCQSTSNADSPYSLIWYANLDRETAFKKDSATHRGIDAAMVTAIAGELQSFAGLSKKIDDSDKALTPPRPCDREETRRV